MQKIKKPLSIILAVLMVMSVFIAVPVSASALTIDDVQSLLSSMEAKINDYNTQGDWDRAGALKDYYDWLDEELEYADGQITPELESAYNKAYEYFMANSGSGVSYPDVNNVYRATNEPVDVTVSNLQPGDVIVTSSESLTVRKGDCNIVLVGGTYGEGDVDEGTLSKTYPNDVTLGNNLGFHFSGNYARIYNGDIGWSYDPVYNNALGNAYMVIGNENGTVYLAGYNFITYTVTWKNGDTVLKTDTVEEGATPTYDGETPTKPEDENYTYTFSGWKNGTNTYGKDETLPAVTADVTYTAQFDAYPKSGSFDGLNWSIDDEGTLTLSGSGAIPEDAFKSNPVIKKVIINSSVTGVGANAFADCANLADLTFDSKSPINFTGGYTYLTDKTTVNVPADSTYQYTVKVSTLATEEPAYKDVLPTLQAEFKNLVAMGYSYEEALAVVLEDYAEWVEDQTGEYPIAHEFEVVLEDENRTGNLTDGQKCETVFGNANIHVIVPTYTVTWKNWNGDVLETDTVAADATPSYDGATPVRPQDANNTYTFAAWDDGTTTYVLGVDDLPPVTGDVTYTATFTAVPKVINYDGEHTLNPNDRITVSDEDEGKEKFDLKLNQYLNMQMLGIQKKSAIATQGGDDGIRFVTAVNSKLLQGSNIDDYGYIVVKAMEGTPVADIYSKMDNLTYDKVANSPKNIFSCYGSDNTISGDFGKFRTNTDYKYVTLSLTNTSGSTDTVAARFYVKTKDNKFYYADYIDGNDVAHGGMAFKLSDVADKLG